MQTGGLEKNRGVGFTPAPLIHSPHTPAQPGEEGREDLWVIGREDCRSSSQGSHGNARTLDNRAAVWQGHCIGREAGWGARIQYTLKTAEDASNTTKIVPFQVQVKPNSKQSKWLLEPA